MDDYKFTDKFFEDEIDKMVVSYMLPSLNYDHKMIINKYLIKLINIIALCYNFNSDKNMYIVQLRQNNYQDAKWLLTHLLPFITSGEMENITSFDDIYVQKKKLVDINQEEPFYRFSNLQYNRCNRDDNKCNERMFVLDDLKHNFYLLIDSIKTMSNKMHVNWIDILPYTLVDYQDTVLYKNTENKNKLNNYEDWDPIIVEDDHLDYTELNDKICSLDMNDIYNVISNDLYHEIKDIKWTLYDIPINKTNTNLFPIIVLLRYLLNIKKCVNNVAWEMLDQGDRDEFIRSWNELIEISEVGNTFILRDFSIENSSLKMMLKGILLSFDKRSIYANIAKKEGYIALKIKRSDDDSEDENVKIDMDKIYTSLKSLHPKFIYQFIMNSVQQLKNTWYGFNLMTKDKTDIDVKYIDNLVLNTKNIMATYKNIYNFAKSLTHFTRGEEYLSFPKHWKTLTYDQKKEILDRLNNKYKATDWFNIKGYIKYLGLNVTYKNIMDINTINTKLHDDIKKKLVNIIFQVLITKGVLTKFVPNKYKTDAKYLNKDDMYLKQNDIFDQSDKNVFWTDAYHYLTLLPYKYMKSFKIKGGDEYNYFSYGLKPGPTWYAVAAYDWIAQIGFCHHFLNNRIIFITGATGVGKSTEIPKLFLYYSKAVDYISAPKVVCTQPRQAPTQSNADRVSTTLGVPIYISDNGKMKESNDYYIQMKHRDDDHINRVYHPMLKYITDGSLILELDYPFIKEKRNDEYNDKNLYDIIMIDEAHEHKINMDLLLTLLKSSVAYNNSLKLVILSATMDEDEAKYRRYYRDINDNRKYPLDSWISEKKIDRINVDRRYHISPPGMGTKYTITELYEPGKNDVEIALDIIRNHSSGDILMFKPGTKEILKTIKELNKTLPSNVIALPYYSDLNKDAKEIIQKIDTTIKTLKINKQDDFGSVENYSEGTGSYNRAIIVATNIAEASITISTLKFVIETGTQKTNVYDYKKRGAAIRSSEISESSRLQRKGRVGRTSSGTVYYTYEKGKMENNKIMCEIAISDLSLELFKRLRKHVSEQEYIPETYDPNKYNTIINYNDVDKIYKNGIDKMIIKQYFNVDKYYDYYGNDTMYDYKNYKDLNKYFESGYNFDTLNDEYGDFYLVHPDELHIKRNIIGKITASLSEEILYDKDKQKIKSKKMDSFWNILHDLLYISVEDSSKEYVKTYFGQNVIELAETFKIDNHNLFRTLIFGLALGLGEDIIRLCYAYQHLDFDMRKIIRMVNKKYDFSKVTLKNQQSDSHALLELINSFILYLSTLKIDVRLNNYTIHSDEYNSEDVKSLLGPPDKYTQNVKDKIVENEDETIKKVEELLISDCEMLLMQKQNEIKSWCNLRNVDFMTMTSYFKTYIKRRSEISRIMTPELIIFIKKMKENVIVKRLHDYFEKMSIKIDNINLALMFGFPFNICRKIDSSLEYISIYSPTLEESYNVPSMSPYKFLPKTFVKQTYLHKYLFYLKLNLETKAIECLHYVTEDAIKMLGNIYNAEHFDNLNNDESFIKADILNYIKNSDAGNTDSIVNYTKTIELIKKECYPTNDSYKKIMESIISLDQ